MRLNEDALRQEFVVMMSNIIIYVHKLVVHASLEMNNQMHEVM
jgi:hypothetical protein